MHTKDALILLAAFAAAASLPASMAAEIGENSCPQWASGSFDGTFCVSDTIILEHGMSAGNYTSRQIDGGIAHWESIAWSTKDSWINSTHAEALPEPDTELLMHLNMDPAYGESTTTVHDFSGKNNVGSIIIPVGYASGVRNEDSDTYSGFTYVINDNPAYRDATISRIEAYLNSCSGCSVQFAAFSKSGDQFTDEERTGYLSATQGYNVWDAPDDFSAMPVAEGEFLGFYITNSGQMERDENEGKGSGYWYSSGDQTDNGSPATFTESATTRAIQVRGWAEGSFAPGVLRDAIELDGHRAFIQVKDSASLDITDEITVMAWVYMEPVQSNEYPKILAKGNPYNFHLTNTTPAAVSLNIIRDGNINQTIASNLPFREWFHVAGTFNATSGKGRIYVNGDLSGEQSFEAGLPIDTDDNNLHIGGFSDFSRTLNGSLDEVILFSRELSEKEIMSHYMRGISRLTMETQVSDDGISWSPWQMMIEPLSTPIMTDSRYMRYRASLNSGNTYYTPALENVRIFFTSETLPVIQFEPPTPQDGAQTSQASVEINVSTHTPLEHSAFIDWNSSLIGWWSFENYNNIGVFDSSGKGGFASYGGGLSSTGAMPGKRGQAMEFDGIDDYLTIGSSEAFNEMDELSITMWVRKHSGQQPYTSPRLIGRGWDSTDNGEWLIHLSGDGASFKLSNGTGAMIVDIFSGDFPEDEWHHLAATFDGTYAKLYLDGVQASNAQAFGSGYLTDTSDIIISQGASSVAFNGTLDEIRVFSRTLTEAEVKASFDAADNSLNTVLAQIPAGEAFYRAIVIDVMGINSSTETRTLTITGAEPEIEGFTISPAELQPGEAVLFGINVTGYFSFVWAEITQPNGTVVYLPLLNNGLVSWNPTGFGTYEVALLANDTTGGILNKTSKLVVAGLASMNISVLDIEGEPLECSLDIFSPLSGERVFQEQDSSRFNISLVDAEYDMVLRAIEGVLELRMNDVNLSALPEATLTIDEAGAAGGLDEVIAVETDIRSANNKVRIYLDNMGFGNISEVGMYICHNWSIQNRSCNSSWQAADYVLNVSGGFIECSTSGFSAFGLLEGVSCGDGICSSLENTSSCPSDCSCNEGETRPCSTTRFGICSVGTETCHENNWTGCPTPETETCNFYDDDCDGIIDNVNGGSSVESTRCQCYNQGTPTSEVCDGIDNNCDGMIDNNDACCSAGQTRPCGPSNNTGICTMGTSLCNNGVFGSCQGAVFPSAEVCGDGLDNDCDGQVDNGCSASACGEGEITSPCICEGSLRGSGYCCSGLYSTEECAQSPWWILIITGIIILIILVILVMYFRSQGKELTWEELRNRYSNKYFPF